MRSIQYFVLLFNSSL